MRKRVKNNKGFTLAELLIVVAIIAVLVAIAIPVFTSQLEKSREATDLANVRSAYAAVVTQYLNDGTSHETKVTAQQTQEKWQTESGTPESATLKGFNETGSYDVSVKAITKGNDWTISIDGNGSVTVNA
jgi:type IV pilus assembly protein PilA